jgi:HPt (histidine-containing phosphotransfer) domain-containing protein
MSEFDTAMDLLAQRFLVRCDNDLAKLKDCLQNSTGKEGEARHIVHRMSGSAGIFGHTTIGALAAQVDGELAAGSPVGTTTLPTLIDALSSLLAAQHDKQAGSS